MPFRILEVQSEGVAERREHPLPEAGGAGGLRRFDRRNRVQPYRGGQREDAERRQDPARAEKKVRLEVTRIRSKMKSPILSPVTTT